MTKTVKTAHVVEDSTSIHIGHGPLPGSNGIKNITFHDGDITLGEISWDTGEFKFNGDTDASAAIFFNEVLKQMCDAYIEQYKDIDLELKGLLLQCVNALESDQSKLVAQIKTYFTQ